MASHNDFGKKGEELAVDYLQMKGYSILERNYTFQKSEIDIIAAKGDVLSIVEVKSRNSVYFESPLEAISRKKIGLMVKAADHYVIENKLDVEVRFDVISILQSGTTFDVEHFEGAFYHF